MSTKVSTFFFNQNLFIICIQYTNLLTVNHLEEVREYLLCNYRKNILLVYFVYSW